MTSPPLIRIPATSMTRCEPGRRPVVSVSSTTNSTSVSVRCVLRHALSAHDCSSSCSNISNNEELLNALRNRVSQIGFFAVLVPSVTPNKCCNSSPSATGCPMLSSSSCARRSKTPCCALASTCVMTNKLPLICWFRSCVPGVYHIAHQSGNSSFSVFPDIVSCSSLCTYATLVMN